MADEVHSPLDGRPFNSSVRYFTSVMEDKIMYFGVIISASAIDNHSPVVVVVQACHFIDYSKPFYHIISTPQIHTIPQNQFPKTSS